MLNALADFLGVDSSYLLTDAGIVFMLIITASLIYIVFKAVYTWFNAIFMK